MKLYEITEALVRIQDEDLPDEELMRVASDLAGHLNQKVEGICRVIFNLEREGEMVEAEIERLKDHASAAKNKAERLRIYLKRGLESIGQNKVKTELFNVSVSDSLPKVIVSSLEDVPASFTHTVIERTVDKKAVLDHFKATGELLPGIQIEQGRTLRIR